jgi:hypothetical protein
MGCPGDVDGCVADTFHCPCGVLACEVHGHADVGDDPYCPHWLRAEILDETAGRGYEDIDLSRWDDGSVRESREMDGPLPRGMEPPDAGAVW